MTEPVLGQHKGLRAILVQITLRDPSPDPKLVAWYLGTFFDRVPHDRAITLLDQARQHYRRREYHRAEQVFADIIRQQKEG